MDDDYYQHSRAGGFNFTYDPDFDKLYMSKKGPCPLAAPDWCDRESNQCEGDSADTWWHTYFRVRVYTNKDGFVHRLDGPALITRSKQFYVINGVDKTDEIRPWLK